MSSDVRDLAQPPSAPTASAPATKSTGNRGERLDFVDVLRGLAVVFMILWHSVDAWLDPALHKTGTFVVLRLLGGLAAPLFVLLAGASLGIRPLPTDPARRNATTLGMIGRGLEVLAFGYALRLQMWAVDGRGWQTWLGWVAVAAGLAGTILFVGGTEQLGGPKPARAALRLSGGIGLFATAVTLAIHIRSSAAVGLLRVDVLQCIGISIVLISLIRHFAPLDRFPAAGVVGGLLLASLTGIVAARLPGAIPVPLASYLAAWPVEPGTSHPSRFPLLPWIAYALVGFTIGTIWRNAAAKNLSLRTGLVLGAMGALLCLVCMESLPHAYRITQAIPQAVYPMRVVYRVGMALVLAAIAVSTVRRDARWHRPLVKLGQTSMLIYWVHIAVAYGVLSKPIKASLGFGTWFVLFLALTLLMLALAELRLRTRARHAQG